MKEKHWAHIRLEGLGAERMINQLQEKGVAMAQLRRRPGLGLEMRVEEKHLSSIEKLAAEKGFQLTVLNHGWKQKLLERLKHRWGLVIGVLLGLFVCIFSLQYVWQIRVEDGGKYSGEVRLFLEEKGLRPGVKQADVDVTALQEELLWRLPRVKWVWVKKEGVALVIRLEEGVEAQPLPEAGNVVAAHAGVLDRLTVFSGTPLCKAGDSVEKGQVLILGQVQDRNGEYHAVPARGVAMAHVQVQKSVRLPLEEMVITPTGRVTERMLYKTPFGTYTFEKEPEFLMADRVYTPLPLPGVWLPAVVIREQFIECSGEYVTRNPDDVMREGQKAAEEALVRAWPDAQNVDKSVNFSMIERGSVEVTASALLLMDIAQYGMTP